MPISPFSTMKTEASPWIAWNTYVKNTTTATTAAVEAWNGWLQNATTTTETATAKLSERVWLKWQTAENWQVARQMAHAATKMTAPPPPLSKREQMIARNRQRSREVRQRNAERRAKALLLDHLTPKQRTEWEDGRYFHVETADGRRRYRIDRGHVGNVRVVLCDEAPPAKADRVRAGTRLCAHPYGDWLPEEDHVLAQKLLLESEGGEAEFLRMANVL